MAASGLCIEVSCEVSLDQAAPQPSFFLYFFELLRVRFPSPASIFARGCGLFSFFKLVHFSTLKYFPIPLQGSEGLLEDIHVDLVADLRVAVDIMTIIKNAPIATIAIYLSSPVIPFN